MRKKHDDDRKSKPISIRFRPSVYRGLVIKAEQENRSIANLIETLVQQYCEPEVKRK